MNLTSNTIINMRVTLYSCWTEVSNALSSFSFLKVSSSAGKVLQSPFDMLLLLYIRVSHNTHFFELSYALLTSHAFGLEEATKKISAL